MSRGALKSLLAFSLLLNLSVLATAGYLRLAERGAWVSPFGTKMPGGRFLFEKLALTREQMATMREKALPFRAQVDRQRDEILAQRRELVRLLRADAPDPAAVDAAIARISALQQTMQRQISNQMLAQKALLNRDQQKAFLDLIESAMTREDR